MKPKQLLFKYCHAGLLLFICILTLFLPTLAINAQEIRITTNPAAQTDPDIWDNYIIYRDNRNPGSGIYVFDLLTSSEFRIASGGGQRIFESKVVYAAYNDIYLYDIGLRTEFRITNDPHLQWAPAIFGNYVLWTDDRNDLGCNFDNIDPDSENTDIYSYNLTTGIESIFSDVGAADHIFIWDDLVSWFILPDCSVPCNGMGSCVGFPTYYYAHLPHPGDIKLVANKYITYVADVSENKILYNYWGPPRYNTNQGLYLFNVDTLEDTLISSSAYDCGAIYGKYVVFRRTGSVVVVHDLKTSVDTDLPIGPVPTCPVIYENKVVYTANRYGNYDIFMYVLKDCDTLNCDDGNPCTNDTCNPVNGCVHVNNAAPCDDGLFCNGTDTCSNGTCGIHAGITCDDGLYCNGVEACNETLERCDAGSPVNCDDSNACTADQCHEASRSCKHKNQSGPCDDGLFCNGADFCRAGACTVHSDLDCNDGNVCTDDFCNESEARCVHSPNTLSCDDGLWCNGTDACSAGSCSIHSGRNCDDHNICTDDSCSEDDDLCEYVNNTAPCDDGIFCNGADICQEGACSDHSGMNCDDSDICTVDSCNESQKLCEHVVDSGQCPPSAIATGAAGESGGGGGCMMSAKADLKNFYVSAALYAIPFLLAIYLRKRKVTKNQPASLG